MRTRRWRRADLVLYAALVACGGSSTDASSSGSITASATPNKLTVFIGGSATTTVHLTRVGGYGLPVTLSIQSAGLPPKVTASLDPTTLTGSTLSSTLTVTAAADATPNGGQVNIDFAGPDGTATYTFVPLTVGRPQVSVVKNGSGAGTVTSSPAGVNCGTTCTSSFAYGTSVTLTATPAAGSSFGGWLGGSCAGTAPICTLVDTAAPNITATFNSTVPGFSLGVSPTTAAVAQGGSSTATVSLTRANGFAGAVALASTGAPAGLTIAANPASVTGNSATLDIAAAASVAAGNYPIVITATSAGVPAQKSTLSVQVTPAAGGSGNVSVSYATCDPSEVPIWFGAQSGTGAWTRVTAGPNNTFTFAAGATGAFAWVTPSGGGFTTNLFYGSRDDITALALGNPCGGLHAALGSAQLTGSVAGIGTPLAVIAIGGAGTEMQPMQGPNFTLFDVPAGQQDLVAAATNVNANGTRTVPRMILRRNIASSGTIPTLNFSGPEIFQPTMFAAASTGATGDQISASVSLVTANGSVGPYYGTPAGPNGGLGYLGIPDSLLQPGDLHAVTVLAATSATVFRLASVLHHSAVGDTVAFGPALNQPTVTSLGTSPYLRLHAQLASQAAYDALARIEYTQTTNAVLVSVSAGYTTNAPATWSLDIPDLSTAGYDPSWGLKTGSPVNWSMFAGGGSVLPLIGATPADGQRAIVAGVSNTSSAFSVARRRRGLSIAKR